MKILRFWVYVSFLGGTAALFGAGGCTAGIPQCRMPVETEPPQIPYLLVEARFRAAGGIPHKLEVNETPAYQEHRVGLRSIAIRLPDDCLNDGAPQITGQANASQTQNLVKTKCGGWLSELEKAIVRSNFRVISWDSLRGMERSQNLAPFDAAKRLGADVLFLFNSADISEIQAGNDASSSIKYFDSDSEGRRFAPRPLPDNERNPIRDFVKVKMHLSNASDSGTVSALASTLDVTAILTDTGESVWFYRNTTTKPLRDSTGRRFLFAKQGAGWLPVLREMGPAAVAIPIVQSSAEDVEQSSVAASNDSFAAERLELVRSGAQDLVDRFRTGSGASQAVQP